MSWFWRSKDKRRAKKDKRKERERAEAEADASDDEEGGEGMEFDGPDNDAMANFMADLASDDGDAASESEEEQPKKKQKKWFQRDMPEEDQSGREIETMDDLEAEAARLLG